MELELLILVLFWCAGILPSTLCLKIQVIDIDGGKVEKELSDSSAAFQERSYLIPANKKDAINGSLIYPNPRNACSIVDLAPDNMVIAFLAEYSACPEASEQNLRSAGFSAFISFSEDKTLVLSRKKYISQALFFDYDFAAYLMKHVIAPGNGSTATLEVLIWDDAFAKLEQLFIIFGAILLVAVLLSVGVFCFSLFCRMALVRWRTRGLSTWQVRALPKRKYRKAKESTDTCSICLEEFREAETVRVLPCDHVFHPKCVDEWLQKWNRTCPLCKSTIRRNGGGRPKPPPAQTDDNEASLLLPQEERVSLDEDVERTDGRGRGYGSAGSTRTHRSQHRRGASGGSNTSTNAGNTAGRTNQVTAAEIELSVEPNSGSVRGRSCSPGSLYHTPLQSDQEENTPSYATAYSSTGFTAEQV